MTSQTNSFSPVRVITFGTFDLLHEGHIRILERAKAEGDYLIVGVSSDQLNEMKGKRSVFPQDQRLAYIKSLKCVDEVFLEESLEKKDEYIRQYSAKILVMGDDWVGKFDWVSCDVKYLPRTEGVSSTIIKEDIKENNKCKIALFADTYIAKHMDCAIGIVNQLTEQNIAPIFTNNKTTPSNIKSNALVYFNLPSEIPPRNYDKLQRVLIDHGASHLKWFLGSRERFDFFDTILTAGPDHVRSLEAIFPGSTGLKKAHASGFIKSEELLCPSVYTRAEICELAGLNPDKPIVLFAPTWHKSRNDDVVVAIEAISAIDNHVASLHPETTSLPLDGLNVVQNINGITSELIKHAAVVISETSSTIYEAAALSVPVIQLLLKEYPDNPAVLYDFPLTAGTAEHFCGGLPCRPSDITAGVERVLSGDPTVLDMIAECQRRVLKGTYIRPDSTKAIAEEIERSMARPVNSRNVRVNGSASASESKLHLRNLHFARHRLIAHGGGNFEGHRVSNSREAVSSALGATRLVELDFCLAADGVVVAHDGREKKYGLRAAFRDTTMAKFESKKFEKTLTPMSLSEVMSVCTRESAGLICDIGSTGADYARIATAIRDAATKHGWLENAVLQCYCFTDFIIALELGFTRTMLSASKLYSDDPIGPTAVEFFSQCIEVNENSVWALALPYQSKLMTQPVNEDPAFPKLYAFWKRIFIHGAPTSKYPDLLRKNLGIFSDSIDERIEFQTIPSSFEWKKYLFLNKDLLEVGIDNECSAALHFVRYGVRDQRKTQYDISANFTYNSYITQNKDLRNASINSFDSAAAHYTKHGKSENRRY